jgi:thiol-disulfide isomerase/thioredoxin
MRAARVIGSIGVLLLTLTAVVGCGGGDGQNVTKDGGVQTLVPVEQRKEPIDLVGTTLTGTRLDVSTLRGKPVVLNVWGSWCPPCRKEAPDLQAAATELGTGAAFVGINTRDDTGQAQAYERRFKVTYPSLVDDGDLLLSLRGAVTSQSPPITIVLDDKGRVAARFIGPVTRRSLVDMVNDVTATG